MAASSTPVLASTAAITTQHRHTRSFMRLRWLWRHHALALVGAVVCSMIMVSALAAPILSPHSPTERNIARRFQPPSAEHLFGTDDFGRDVFTRVLYGARPILFVSIASVVLAQAVGLTIGVAAAWFGGQVDQALMRLMDVMLSFPAVLLAILIVTGLGANLLNSIVAISFALTPVFARLMRASATTILNEAYVESAHALGMPSWAILFRHVLPNMRSVILVNATVNLAIAMSYASALNFLGLGVQPPTPDWGLMVNDGKRFIFDHPHLLFFPGLAITLTVLSVNFIGDALRDYFDPTLRLR